MIPIYIPSKGDPDNKTSRLFKGRRDYTVFVEPSELDLYRKVHADVVSIEENNLGNGYVMRYIQRYADRNDVAISWILDDDFRELYRLPADPGARPEAGGAAILAEAEEAVLTEDFLNLTPPVAAAHFEFNEPRTRNPRPFTFHKVPVMGLLVIWDRVRAAGAEYDADPATHWDVDFAFQLFRAGFTTAQFNRFAQKVAPSLSNYTHPDYFRRCERMVGRWGDWVKIVPNPKIYSGTDRVPVEKRVQLQRNHRAWKKYLGV